MARLKVKQISDFTTAVQNLIDNDADQNAGLIDALEASVDSLEALNSAGTGALEDSVDSLELVASTAITERGELSASVDSLAVVDGELSDAISVETSRAKVAEGFLADSVDSLEVVDGEQNKSIDSLETAISNILDIPGTDLDQFSEMVTFVKSVDTVNDNLLSDYIGVANASIDSLEAVTGAATADLEASVDSLETAEDNAIASIDSLESVDSALSAEIAANASAIGDNDTDIADLVASVDSLETAEDNAIASIDSLETVDADLASDIAANALYLHQFGSVASPTEFIIAQNVRHGVNDDLKVSVNGHVLHPVSDGFADGYVTADGARFDVSAIGYTLDVEDHVYVIGIKG